MKRIIIYGTSNLDVIKLLAAMKTTSAGWGICVQGFLDDMMKELSFMGYPVFGGREKVVLFAPDHYFVNNVTGQHRQLIQDNIQGCILFSVVHPNVDMNYVTTGGGLIIAEGVRFGANVVVGDCCVVKYNAVVSHDCVLEDMVFVGPGAVLCGKVQIGAGSYIGARAVVKENIVIGKNAMVGIGAVVVKDVPDGVTVVGNPAKAIKR